MSMNAEERRLLLMVAKDLRRLWDKNPEHFGILPGYSLYATRKTEYDIAISEVERVKKHETNIPGNRDSVGYPLGGGHDMD